MWITFLQQWNNNQQKHSLCLPGKLQVESGQCEVPSSFLLLSENCKKTKIQRLFYCLHVFLNEKKKISNTFMKTKQFSAFLNLFYHKVTFCCCSSSPSDMNAKGRVSPEWFYIQFANYMTFIIYRTWYAIWISFCQQRMWNHTDYATVAGTILSLLLGSFSCTRETIWLVKLNLNGGGANEQNNSSSFMAFIML